MPPAMAQSNATGNIYGRVDAPAGASVNLLNTDTGLTPHRHRRCTGRYQVTALPIGHYKSRTDARRRRRQTAEVDVIIGQGVEASFAAAAGVQTVQVTGRRSRIDVSNTNNGATFTARELAKLPIAPTSTRSSSWRRTPPVPTPRYGGGASFGGGGASENAYYINGFPVTNPLTQLGASELPFGAIAQAQILTGGFGAEFGRSVGGVVNITTKSGTNNWEVGAHRASVAPKSLRVEVEGHLLPQHRRPEQRRHRRHAVPRAARTTTARPTVGAYVGGPLIKDKLFMFAVG